MATKYDKLFAALAAPFTKDQVRSFERGGRKLLYVTARMVMNRLDDVLGPENWYDTYEETQAGIRCRLFVRLPNGEWISKEDGSGHQGNDRLDPEDAEKSTYSDAFKRASVKWGVGRHLYRDGVPDFVRETLGVANREHQTT